ncbi:hypothetical protein BSL78_19086 [Apostichopus japonicus]|uniref:Uncharacterized protein n=1 Tax=Stichopus japonicus TaxID=307972 RepID=A0A2G8K7Z3_STIJA|nr:hypothetical protein BSL78_19086 [Apostichopus japonicus]
MANNTMEELEESFSIDSISRDLHQPLTNSEIMNEAEAVRICPLSEFVTSLPDAFTCQLQPSEPRLRASISPAEPDDIIVCIESNMLQAHRLVFPENRGRILMSRTVNQMNGLAYQLISRPLLMVVRVMYRAQRNSKWYLQVAYLTVLINTKHPSIQSQLEDGLKRGLRSITNGRQFAVELNFNAMIASWLKTVLCREHVLWTTSHSCEFFLRCEGASLVITNCSEYNSLFDVRAPGCCCIWMFCLPCCLITCPAYTVTRRITVDDHTVNIKAESSYWDLQNHETAEEAVIHLREILCGENVDWNQVYEVLWRRCTEERLRARGERRSNDSPHHGVVSSQPQGSSSSSDADLPSYEEAVLLSGKVNDAMVLQES